MVTQSIADPAIRVRGLERSYGKLDVLRGVDFDVARGGNLALLGSNGAGKPTTVRILATLLKADAGTAEVHGVDVFTQPGRGYPDMVRLYGFSPGSPTGRPAIHGSSRSPTSWSA